MMLYVGQTVVSPKTKTVEMI